MARLAVAALTLGVVTTASHATLTTYKGQQLVDVDVNQFAPPTTGLAVRKRAEFINSISLVAEEGFEPTESGDPVELSNLLGGRASLSGGGAIETVMCGREPIKCYGRFNTTAGGNTWYESDVSFTLFFVNPVNAFGFYLTDYGDFAGQLSLELTIGKGETAITETEPLAPFRVDGFTPDSGSLAFFGFTTVGKGYDSITFNIRQVNPNDRDSFDWIGIDDLMIGSFVADQGSAVPEPATLMLTGLGLLGLAASRRKQRH